MRSRTHSGEPWWLGTMLVDPGVEGWDGTVQSGPSDEEKAYEVAEVRDETDAERIVVCVNFCAGVPTNRLADAGTGALAQIVDPACVALFGAAPDMMAACEAIVSGWGHQDGVSRAVKLARAAISKAKGAS